MPTPTIVKPAEKSTLGLFFASPSSIAERISDGVTSEVAVTARTQTKSATICQRYGFMVLKRRKRIFKVIFSKIQERSKDSRKQQDVKPPPIEKSAAILYHNQCH